MRPTGSASGAAGARAAIEYYGVSRATIRVGRAVSLEPVYTYDFSKIEVYEGGASLLTLLAYPEPNSEDKRGGLQASLCTL